MLDDLEKRKIMGQDAWDTVNPWAWMLANLPFSLLFLLTPLSGRNINKLTRCPPFEIVHAR
jgi:hypothetical protein